jgi:glycosyltransferase involved in cell wall biosynthesis
MSGPDVSVVVPTRDRPESLARCLRALGQQTLGDALELIVVDDGSRQADYVAAVAGASGARTVRTAGTGPAAARNAGAGAAETAVLCFADDDTSPLPDWAERLLEAIRLGADAVAGRTLLASTASPFAEASQAIADHVGDFTRRRADSIPFAAANNLACRRDVLTAIPFDPRYPEPGGEDRDWCARLVGAGYSLTTEPGAKLVHLPALGPIAFWRQHVRYGRGAYRYGRRHREGRLEEPAFYRELIGKGLASGPAVGTLVALAQVATAVGFVEQAVASRADGRPG